MKPLLLSLPLLLCLSLGAQPALQVRGAAVRGDSTKKEIALVFTADEFGEGLPAIVATLKNKNVKAGFFFTGRFYRNKDSQKGIRQLARQGHYLGPHSNNHLLYCDWANRDSLLVTRDSFENDIAGNLGAMRDAGLPLRTPHLFIPPYEWWNDSVATWSNAAGLRLVSLTPGTRTAADYTWPAMGAGYKSSGWIMNWLKETADAAPHTLNGSVLLIHAGTDPRRTDKLYNRLAELIALLKGKGFSLVRIDALLNP